MRGRLLCGMFIWIILHRQSTIFRILFDCKVILGGYVGAYIGDYLEDLYQRVDEKNPFEDKAEDYIFACRYKKEASAAGAAIFFVDEFLSDI